MADTIKLKRKDYISGLFLLIALILLVSISIYTNYGNLSRKYIPYYTYFDSSYGITKNAQVYYLEMSIGHVSDVTIVGLDKIRMKLMINKKYNKLIKKDSKVSILSSLGISTILNGKGLQIIGGKSNELLPPNSKIKSIAPESIESMIKKFEIDKISKSLKHIIVNIELLTSQLVDKNGGFQQSIVTINQLSKKLINRPTLEVLLGKKDFYKISILLTNLNKTILETQDVIKRINHIANSNKIKNSITH